MSFRAPGLTSINFMIFQLITSYIMSSRAFARFMLNWFVLLMKHSSKNEHQSFTLDLFESWLLFDLESERAPERLDTFISDDFEFIIDCRMSSKGPGRIHQLWSLSVIKQSKKNSRAPGQLYITLYCFSVQSQLKNELQSCKLDYSNLWCFNQ